MSKPLSSSFLTTESHSSVIQDCITVLIGPPSGEFNENISPDTEDNNDEDEIEEDYEMHL